MTKFGTLLKVNLRQLFRARKNTSKKTMPVWGIYIVLGVVLLPLLAMLFSTFVSAGEFLSEPQYGLSLYLERTRVHLLSVQGNESCIALIGLDRREQGFGEVLYLQRILHADSNSGDIEHIQQQGAVIPCRLHNTVDTAVFGESPDKLSDTSGRVVKSTDLPAFVGGVSYHECSLAHVDSNVPHGRSFFGFNDIAYILVLHCEYGLRHLTNYPDSDVKSMGSEHNSRFRKPMRDRTYSIL